MKKDPNITRLLKTGQLEIPDRNFEDKVMEKIEYVHLYKKQKNKNLRLSWVFLILSVILIPVAIIVVSQNFNLEMIMGRAISVNGIGQSVMPAIILLSSIIILLQVDNLFHLTLKAR